MSYKCIKMHYTCVGKKKLHYVLKSNYACNTDVLLNVLKVNHACNIDIL